VNLKEETEHLKEREVPVSKGVSFTYFFYLLKRISDQAWTLVPDYITMRSVYSILPLVLAVSSGAVEAAFTPKA